MRTCTGSPPRLNCLVATAVSPARRHDLNPADPGLTPESLWRDAEAAFKRRDYAEAARLLQVLASDASAPSGLDPGAVELQLGIALLRLERTAEGVEALARAAALAPGSARIRRKLGTGLSRLGREDEALAELQRAVELDPAVADYQWRLGDQHHRMGHAAEAHRAYERALEIEPGHAFSHQGLARLKRTPLRRLARLVRGLIGR